MAMQNETDIALANLDWLMVHEDMRLDYSVRAVLNTDGTAAYTLSDLSIAGLTPATKHWDGRLSLPICTEAATSSPNDWIPGAATAMGFPEHDWKVRSPALPPEER